MAEAAKIQAEAPADEPVEEPAAEQAVTSAPIGGTAILMERFLIDGGAPLPHLDSPNARAYAAFDREEEGYKLFALICQPGMPVRIDTMRKLKSTHNKGVLPLVEWGPMDWPALGHRAMAVVYEMPLGGRLSDAIASKKTRLNEYDIVRRILEPVVSGITSLLTLGVPHRAIRPDNMFFMDEECEDLVLGECVTTPPGYDQPTIFETIPCSMATPAGRGIGGGTDDMYALGVSLVFLLLGFNPAEKYKDLLLLALKVERGTYATVCGNSRLPLSMIEVLRGLLVDDVNARWGSEEVETWIAGNKRTPIQRHGLPKASSPYMFQGQPHNSPITLAFSFAGHQVEALRTLKSDETLDAWLRKGLNNEPMADQIKAIVEQAGGSSVDDDVVIARACMALDPDGPIRFRNISIMPDAMGTELAHEMLIQKNVTPIIDLISKELYDTWFNNNSSKDPTIINAKRQFLRCRSYLKSEDMGYGIHRCLYETNPGIPCQSSLIKDGFIAEIKELLPALDRAANHVDADERPLDRHITAFIVANITDDIQPHLRAIASDEEARRVIGTLSLLAYLQWKFKAPALLGLASWLGGLLGPAINTYHSRSTRRHLEKEIPQLVRKGSLPELFDLVDNAERRQIDSGGFVEAQAEFLKAEAEVYEIEGEEGERDGRILKSGQKTTALLSILLSMTIVTMLFLLKIWP